MRSNVGLSESFKRNQAETATSTTETRNGIRQPQTPKAASPTRVRVIRVTIRAAISPKAAEAPIQLVIIPRLLSGECSAM
jgi:hypothetical protein